ncbi:DNA-binding transcriptional LysR family regulator [Pedobacter cryoconitis]|uniref:DNA-binding transcriptional LysR family regulator n=1 Tax=Pedobacter cryoconitis TaxID=188932 RepID=A0A7W8ZHY3_9SPHI|nr:LysR family transcriptional regulator [Pedobacter cryoconitis]MBB5634384.1 DNA-binding transcriptional LysR family regulator [Pedobacter cryoconitis]
MVNFEWYRTFIAIYQQGNLTRAAQELSISQPNASVHLASLEQYAGGKLFDRMPRKMVPTELGKKLYIQVVGSVENLSLVETSFRRKALNNRPVIKLGSPLEFFFSQITPQLENISSQLHVSFGVAKDLMQQLAEGKLDLVIASQKTIESKHILYEPILTENFIIIGNKNIDLQDFRQHLENQDLNAIEKWLINQEWYAYSNDLVFIRRFWLKNFNKRPIILPKYIIPNLSVIIKSIAEGGGISIVSDYLAQEFINQEKITVIWDGAAQTSNTIYLAYDKSKISIEKVEEIKRLTETIRFPNF